LYRARVPSQSATGSALFPLGGRAGKRLGVGGRARGNEEQGGEKGGDAESHGVFPWFGSFGPKERGGSLAGKDSGNNPDNRRPQADPTDSEAALYRSLALGDSFLLFSSYS
jgi:hypothetical protein